jgi:hypothetical protein
VQRIAAHFGEQAVLLTGATPSAKRQGLVDRFQDDPEVRVMVANVIAGGVGITLTAARQVVFNDLDWVPANHWQAEDRAYRIGQTNAVNVTYFTAEGTIDEFVAHALRTKAALIEAVVKGRGEVPTDGDLFAELEALVASLSPKLASLGDEESGEDPVDRLLREAVAAVGAERVGGDARGARRAARAPRGRDPGAGPGAQRAGHLALPREERLQAGRLLRPGRGRRGRALQLPRLRIPRRLPPRAGAEGGARRRHGSAGGVRAARLRPPSPHPVPRPGGDPFRNRRISPRSNPPLALPDRWCGLDLEPGHRCRPPPRLRPAAPVPDTKPRRRRR